MKLEKAIGPGGIPVGVVSNPTTSKRNCKLLKYVIFRRFDDSILDRKKTNEEVLKLSGIKCSFTKTFMGRHLKFLGFIKNKKGNEGSCSVVKVKGKEGKKEKKKQHYSGWLYDFAKNGRSTTGLSVWLRAGWNGGS